LNILTKNRDKNGSDKEIGRVGKRGKKFERFGIVRASFKGKVGRSTRRSKEVAVLN
jgi:hypothetical protein